MAQQDKRQYVVSIAIIGVLFFIFGFVTWLNGTLIPFLKLACDVTETESYLVASAFYASYFFLALPSSFILSKTGFKKGMSIGLFIMAGGALLFIPAAASRQFPLFLSAQFVLGIGLSLLQTACNPFISVIGPIESAARRISIMGICNKAAGVASPLILSSILLAGASSVEAKIKTTTDLAARAALLQELADRIRLPYIVMAVVLGLFAIAILKSPLPELDKDGEEAADSAASARKTSVFQFPHVLLGALCIFVYVAAEVMAGDVIGPYGRRLGISLDETKNFTAYTLTSMVVGYIIGILTIPRYLKQETALKLSAIVGLLFTSIAYLASGYTSILFIALLGLANALMWPAIFPMAIDGLGRFTKVGSALLIMGIIGGAVIPPLYGKLAETIDVQKAFFYCTLPCYLYILFFATKGHRAGRSRAVTRG